MSFEKLIQQALHAAYREFSESQSDSHPTYIVEQFVDLSHCQNLGEFNEAAQNIVSTNNLSYTDVVVGCNDDGRIGIWYEKQQPMTGKRKDAYLRRRFQSRAFHHVYELLVRHGYERIGFKSNLLAKFDDTSAYDMYINKEYDRLAEYYALAFAPPEVPDVTH